MSDADKRQVGGDHYKKMKDPATEHWNIVIAHDLDYFQAQMLRYILRWKHKHPTSAERRKDLEKVGHYYEKYLENFELYDRKVAAWQIRVAPNGWKLEGFYDDSMMLYTCPKCEGMVKATSMGHAMEQHQERSGCNGACS